MVQAYKDSYILMHKLALFCSKPEDDASLTNDLLLSVEAFGTTALAIGPVNCSLSLRDLSRFWLVCSSPCGTLCGTMCLAEEIVLSMALRAPLSTCAMD